MLRSIAGLAGLLAAAATAAPRQQADLLIRHATVVDIANGRTIADQAIVVAGDTIRAVGPDGSISRRYAGKSRVDATGKFVMPGLWDMHVHFGGGPELIEENKNLLPLLASDAWHRGAWRNREKRRFAKLFD